MLRNGNGLYLLELYEVSVPRGRSIPLHALWGDHGYLEICHLCDDIMQPHHGSKGDSAGCSGGRRAPAGAPIHKIERVRAPVLVLHGANDTNVPVVEADQVVDNLKKRSVPVEYVLCADEGHGFRKTSNRILGNVATVEWFEKHLKGR